MSKKDILRIPDYLGHILEAIQRVNVYIEGMPLLDFLENNLVQDAVVRNIEIMGEASRNIQRYYPDFAEKYSEVPWNNIYLMRNKICHGYFSLDYKIVWYTIEKDLPELQQKIQAVYNQINSKI